MYGTNRIPNEFKICSTNITRNLSTDFSMKLNHEYYKKIFWQVSYSKILFNVIKMKLFHLAYVVLFLYLTKKNSNLIFLSYNPVHDGVYNNPVR